MEAKVRELELRAEHKIVRAEYIDRSDCVPDRTGDELSDSAATLSTLIVASHFCSAAPMAIGRASL